MSDVIKTKVEMPNPQALQKLFPELPVKEDTDVFLVTTADGMLIEFDIMENDGLGKAILPVHLIEMDDGSISIRRGKAA